MSSSSDLRQSRRKKTPSVKAELNASVARTSLKTPEENATAPLCVENVRAKKRRREMEDANDLDVKLTQKRQCKVSAGPELSGRGVEERQCEVKVAAGPELSGGPGSDAYPFIRGRSVQIHLLTRLLTGESLPPLLCVYGVNGSGKTYTLTSVLTQLKLQHAVVNCRECYCPELLFKEILTQLSTAASMADWRCNCVRRFLPLFKQLSCMQNQNPTCIVLDNAECLREHPLLLSALTRLSELSGSCRLCVVLVTAVAANELFCRQEFLRALPIHFPQYSKEEVLAIMLLDCPSDKPLPFFRTFVHHIWNVFHTICRDVSELRHLSSTLFSKYMEPVDKEELTYQNTRQLWKHIEPYFKTVMNRVFLREVTLKKTEGGYAPLSLCELPLYSQYLLLASYLASYNPSRTDRRFFSKLKLPKVRHSKPSTEQGGHKLGPKDFPLDRMMAIFYSIFTETVPPIASLYSQVSTLVSLQLLAQTSKSECLDIPKYKSLIGLAVAQQVSRIVGFELVAHLHDPNS